MSARVRPFGERGLLLELEQRIDQKVAARAAAIANAWEALGHGVAVPTYASVLLRFDPLLLAWRDAVRLAEELSVRELEAAFETNRTVTIPTRYDGTDLEDTAVLSGMSVAQLIRAHTSRSYLAFFVGFMPGYAYCGRLDERIHAPRLPVPRTRVPAGAVAVADGQTAIYPFASPGGWRLIGTTDLRVFDAARDPAALVRAGDRVRFVAL